MDEKTLLNKIEAAELRLAAADDTKLHKLLDPALPNIIGFLQHPSRILRDRVLALLKHLNVRIHGQPTLKLPLKTLAAAYARQHDKPLCSNMSLSYIEMAIARADDDERANVVPALLAGASRRSAAQQQILLQLLLAALPAIRLPERAVEMDATLPFLASDDDRALVLGFLLDLLFFVPQPSATQGGGAVPLPPGLCASAVARLRAKLPLDELRGEALAAKKRAALRLLRASRGLVEANAAPLFETHEVLRHWLVAASDADAAVVREGEGALRECGRIELDASALIDEVAELAGCGVHPAAVNPADARRPPSASVRLRALGQLIRSRAAASRPAALQAALSALFGVESTPRLQEAGCDLVRHVATGVEEGAQLEVAASSLVSAALRVVRSDGITPSVSARAHAYETLAALARRVPHKLRADAQLPAELFAHLSREDAGARTPLHDALSALADVHAAAATDGGTSSAAATLRQLLAGAAAEASPQARLLAMTWVGRVFRSDDVPMRLIALSCVGDARSEVREAAIAALRPRNAEAGTGAEILTRGQRVVYAARDGVRRAATVANVHAETTPPHYTILLDGSERQTERARLEPLAPGWPAFGPLARAVLARTALQPPAAGAVWAVAVDPGFETSGGILPETSLAAALSLLSDSLAREAVSLHATSEAGTREDNFEEVALGKYIPHLLQDAHSGVAELLALLERCLVSDGASVPLRRVASETLLSLVRSCDALAQPVAAAEEMLRRVALGDGEANESTQRAIANTLALASAHWLLPRATGLLEWATSALPRGDESAAGASQGRRVIGAALLVGSISARLRSRLQGEVMPVEEAEAAPARAALEAGCRRLAMLIRHRQAHVASAACNALGELGLVGPLPLPLGSVAASLLPTDANGSSATIAPGESEAPAAAEEELDSAEGATAGALVRALCALAARQGKTRVAAVQTLGRLCAGDPHGAHRNEILRALFGLAPVKDSELHDAVGEALSALSCGSALVSGASSSTAVLPPPPPPIDAVESPAVVTGLSAREVRVEEASACSLVGGEPLLRYVLVRLLLRHAVSWAPLERLAASSWLLALIRQHGGAPQVAQRATLVQRVLVGLLADANELTQELASKALAALHDASDSATREASLAELSRSLQTARGANAGASGGDLGTYKELSEVAAEAGQPGLVYKLMECAATSAAWNAKKGVAFALAAHSREALEPHLPSLVPTLYRHSFDPNPRIGTPMKALWSALVPDAKATLSIHFDAVLAHLLAGLGDRAWRAREASALALAELVPQCDAGNFTAQAAVLFRALLRALDDIKESVRNASQGAWRALCSATNRLSDGGTSSPADARAVLDAILPILLDKGLTHSEAEVRALCGKQILKMTATAGANLAPHTPLLVPFLLEALSSLEDPRLAYTQQHASSILGDKGDAAFESARVAATRASDAATALERCVPLMGDVHVLEALPALENLLVRGVGLPTRTGTARFVMRLAHERGDVLEPRAQRILDSVVGGILSDTSFVVQRAYASAAAQLAKHVGPDKLGDLVRCLSSRYISDEVIRSDEERLTVALLASELLRGAPDAMAAIRVDWVPLAFIGRHEPRWASEDDGVSLSEARHSPGKLAEAWREMYDEAGINKGAVAVHVAEIFEMLRQLVNGASWALRRASAHALVELAELGLLQSRYADDAAALAVLLRSRKWRDKEATLPKLDEAFPPSSGAAASAVPVDDAA